MTELTADLDTEVIGALTTTIIECESLATTLPFYTDQLGLHVKFGSDGFKVLDTGSGTIVLWQGQKSGVVVAFTGANLEQARRLLQARGAEVGPNDTHPTGEHFYVQDPEGNCIMIST